MGNTEALRLRFDDVQCSLDFATMSQLTTMKLEMVDVLHY